MTGRAHHTDIWDVLNCGECAAFTVSQQPTPSPMQEPSGDPNASSAINVLKHVFVLHHLQRNYKRPTLNAAATHLLSPVPSQRIFQIKMAPSIRSIYALQHSSVSSRYVSKSTNLPSYEGVAVSFSIRSREEKCERQNQGSIMLKGQVGGLSQVESSHGDTNVQHQSISASVSLTPAAAFVPRRHCWVIEIASLLPPPLDGFSRSRRVSPIQYCVRCIFVCADTLRSKAPLCSSGLEVE